MCNEMLGTKNASAWRDATYSPPPRRLPGVQCTSGHGERYLFPRARPERRRVRIAIGGGGRCRGGEPLRPGGQGPRRQALAEGVRQPEEGQGARRDAQEAGKRALRRRRR